MKKPERGIGRVIEPIALPLGKQVGNEPVAHIAGEGPQDIACLRLPARDQCQPFQTDHRVAAPIGEPVVAGDHAANFISGGLCLGLVGHAAGGTDQELVGGQHQLGGRAVVHFGPGLIQKPRAAFQLRVAGGGGIGREDRVPAFRRSNQARLLPGRQLGAEVARAPQAAHARVTALFLQAVAHLAHVAAVQEQARQRCRDAKAQRWSDLRLDLEAVAEGRHAVGAGYGCIDGVVVAAKMERRP